jgi:hypothetical protein
MVRARRAGLCKSCLPRLPNEIFVARISSGFNFEEQRSGFNQGVPEAFKMEWILF